MSHESRSDECDIGFSSEIYIGIHQLGNKFFLISLKENKLGCLPFVNRTRLFGSFHWKISGRNGTSEKPGSPVFPLETFRWKCVFHLQVLKGLTSSRLFTAIF